MTDKFISIGLGLILGFNVENMVMNELTFTNGITTLASFITLWIFIMREV